MFGLMWAVRGLYNMSGRRGWVVGEGVGMWVAGSTFSMQVGQLVTWQKGGQLDH